MPRWGGKKGHKSRLKLEMSANANWAARGNGSWLPSNHIGKLTETKLFLEAKVRFQNQHWMKIVTQLKMKVKCRRVIVR